MSLPIPPHSLACWTFAGTPQMQMRGAVCISLCKEGDSKQGTLVLQVQEKRVWLF